jgi:hypothetical protein
MAGRRLYQLMTQFRSQQSPCFRQLVRILILLIVVAPLIRAPRLEARSESFIDKLSPALQQALVGATDLVWSNQSARTLRVLIQTNGPVSPALTAAIALRGGAVVRLFTSIDGLLAELPAEIARTRSGPMERMTADHLAEQASSHLRRQLSPMAAGQTVLGNGFVGLDGTGVGIAILDSESCPGTVTSQSSVAVSRHCTSKTSFQRIRICRGRERGWDHERASRSPVPVPAGNKDAMALASCSRRRG